MNGYWIGEGLNGRYSKSEHKQSLVNVVTCLGTRGEIGLERVLFGEMSLDKCVRIKHGPLHQKIKRFNFESDEGLPAVLKEKTTLLEF